MPPSDKGQRRPQDVTSTDGWTTSKDRLPLSDAEPLVGLGPAADLLNATVRDFWAFAMSDLRMSNVRVVEGGRVVQVMSVHDPADTRGPAQQWRTVSEQRQHETATYIARHDEQLLLLGDFNDKRETVLPTHRHRSAPSRLWRHHRPTPRHP